MANRMHDDWVKQKAFLQKQVDDVKKNGGLNPKQIQDALKSFDGGLGPTLDRLAEAYKAKKDADVKKYAERAITTAKNYLATVTKISNERGTGTKIALSAMLTKLEGLKAKGSAFTPNPF
jgi:hypothetical protein